jgi:hypothetical protein
MQFAKDSFYIALRERLESLAPSRIIERNGVRRPAILVAENELPSSAPRSLDAYYIEFGEVIPTKSQSEQPLMCMECFLWYQTQGDSESAIDRGRKLGLLDLDLMAICQPPYTRKRNFLVSPSVDLGTGVFWSTPIFEAAKERATVDGSRQIERWARVLLYFYAEVKPQ